MKSYDDDWNCDGGDDDCCWMNDGMRVDDVIDEGDENDLPSSSQQGTDTV